MDDERNGSGVEPDEAGQPVDELSRLAVEVDSNFVGRVRGRIERRAVTGHFLSLSWHATAAIVLEFLGMIFETLGLGGPKGGSK